jgi:hypothetical protein
MFFVEGAKPKTRRAIMKAQDFLVIGLVDGSAEDARAAICVDLDRGNTTEEWAALVHVDRVQELLDQTGGEEVSRSIWNGERFGDGNGGIVEMIGDEIVGSGLYRPALAQ